jgi:hypothetical protein
MRLAREDELDANSEVFAILYRSLSMLMRSPEEYLRVVKILLWFSGRRWDAGEMQEITPKEGELLIEYARRLDLLCRDYDRFYRFLSWCSKKRGDASDGDELPYFLRFRLMQKELERVRKVRQVKASLIEAGTNAAAA